MTAMSCRAAICTRRLRSAWGMQLPSGLLSVGTTITALTGWVSNASCSASSERPLRGWVGISSALRCRPCSTSRNEKCVGDSSATTSPGCVTARRHSAMESMQPPVITMFSGSRLQPMPTA
ncbi:hypothetical protein D3C72_1953550 [compost metagenome]